MQVQEHVLAVNSAELRPVRLILGVLNALRSIYLDAVTGVTSKASQHSNVGQAASWQKASPVSYSCPAEIMLAVHLCVHSLEERE